VGHVRGTFENCHVIADVVVGIGTVYKLVLAVRPALSTYISSVTVGTVTVCTITSPGYSRRLAVKST